MNIEYSTLEKKINYTFKDKAFLEEALIHPSYRHENHTEQRDNQRYEFLGDAVLGLIAATHLFQHFPSLQEGNLTQKRSAITNTTFLAGVARDIRLDQHLMLGKGEASSGGSNRESNLADALEALFAAVYLDGGMAAARELFFLLIQPKNLPTELQLIEDNPKGKLQEFCQAQFEAIPEYTLLEEIGPQHARMFTYRVTVDKKLYGEGTASQKRKAQALAASAALENLQNEYSATLND